jgi:hypothetical protein
MVEAMIARSRSAKPRGSKNSNAHPAMRGFGSPFHQTRFMDSLSSILTTIQPGRKPPNSARSIEPYSTEVPYNP